MVRETGDFADGRSQGADDGREDFARRILVASFDLGQVLRRNTGAGCCVVQGFTAPLPTLTQPMSDHLSPQRLDSRRFGCSSYDCSRFDCSARFDADDLTHVSNPSPTPRVGQGDSAQSRAAYFSAKAFGIHDWESTGGREYRRF